MRLLRNLVTHEALTLGAGPSALSPDDCSGSECPVHVLCGVPIRPSEFDFPVLNFLSLMFYLFYACVAF
jgi:hypothetical protein